MPGGSFSILTTKPGFGDAQRTCTPLGENEIAVDPPMRLKVSVCPAAAVVGGAVVTLEFVVDVAVDIGGCVGLGVDEGWLGVVVARADELDSTAVVVACAPGTSLSTARSISSSDVVSSAARGVAPNVGDALSSAGLWNSAAGAGSIISLSTTATPLQATPIAALLPASQSKMNPIVRTASVSLETRSRSLK